MSGADVKRFWSKVEKGDGCWNWTGTRVNQKGYGGFTVKGKHLRAHRFAYELLVGPIPDGLTIDHLCRNKLCVNPSHLEPVTRLENMRRAGQIKLTPEDVAAIRKDSGSVVAISERFGVHHSTVSLLRSGKTWSHSPSTGSGGPDGQEDSGV